jgi:[pyruvate, water dikinase]-phosphate phosphotransferase / [pyruvate, water dikinase] kinase
MPQRSVFFISDGTGITAETLGHSLIAHFSSTTFRQIRLPFMDTPEKASVALRQISQHETEDGCRAILVMTLVNSKVRTIFESSGALCLDLFGTFIGPLTEELGQTPVRAVGMARGVASSEYSGRLDAINFTLRHDDGLHDDSMAEADVILVGVSRVGKTPTSLYLAMQFGVKTANYPLIPEDFERLQLPGSLAQHRGKLFGLTIAPDRLHKMRQERRPDSFYASMDNCRTEVRLAEDMMQREGIRWLDSTTRSIEEIATSVLQEVGLNRNQS